MVHRYLHSLKKMLLWLVAVVMLVASTPPALAFAQGEEEAPANTDVTLEEFYRESEIQFLGKDLSSCSSSPSGGPANISVGKNFTLGSEAKERRVNLLKALMRDFSLTAEQAAGIVGNFMHESGGDYLPPNANFGPKFGPPNFQGPYGWAQWLGGRLKAFIKHATDNGYMASDKVDATDAANYAWLTVELGTTESKAIPEVKKANTPEDAARNWEKSFERSGGAGMAERTKYARQVFNEFTGGGTAGGDGPVSNSGQTGCSAGGNVALVGDQAFPLATSKSEMNSKNPGLFKNGTTGQGGHPYTAFDILADPGTEVVAFMGGKVSHITKDRCPGRLISIYNPTSDVTISYLHLDMNESTHIGEGTTVKAGDHVGVVGEAGAGCGTPHLHIDAARGDRRPGCSRNNCPATNASRFIDIGPGLFTTYEALQN